MKQGSQFQKKQLDNFVSFPLEKRKWDEEEWNTGLLFIVYLLSLTELFHFSTIWFLTIILIKLILKNQWKSGRRWKLTISIASSSIYSSGLGKVTSALNSTELLSLWIQADSSIFSLYRILSALQHLTSIIPSLPLGSRIWRLIFFFMPLVTPL